MTFTNCNQRPNKTGENYRTRFHLLLKGRALICLGATAYNDEADPWIEADCRRTGQHRPSPWTTPRVRREIVHVADALRKFHFHNTGKEVTRQEVISALIATGLQHLGRELPEFRRPQQ